MKRYFHWLIVLVAVTVLTGCETTKYAFNQTFGDQREYGPFQSKLDKPQHSDDILLADADDWVKKHIW